MIESRGSKKVRLLPVSFQVFLYIRHGEAINENMASVSPSKNRKAMDTKYMQHGIPRVSEQESATTPEARQKELDKIKKYRALVAAVQQAVIINIRSSMHISDCHRPATTPIPSPPSP